MILIFLLATILLTGLFLVTSIRNGETGTSAFWFVMLTLVFFLGAFITQWGISNFSETDPVSDGVLTICLGLVFFICGARVGKLRLLADQLPRKTKPAAQPTRDDRWANRILIILTVAVLLPSWLYFALLGSVPLFAGVGAVVEDGYGGLGALQSARLNNTPHLSGQSIPLKGVLDLMRNYGVLFLIGIALTQLLQGKSKFLRVSIIGAAVLTAAAGGQRWQLIYVFMVALVAVALMRQRGFSVPLGRLLKWGGVLGVLAFALTVLQRRTTDTITGLAEAVQFAFINLSERILYDQSAAPILSFVYQSFEPGELRGKTYVQALLAYVPGLDIQSFEVDFFLKVYGGTAAFTAAPGFFTEAFINFGFIGVAMLSLLWGFMLARVDRSAFWDQSSTALGAKAATVAMLAGTSFAGAGLVVSCLLLLAYVLVIRGGVIWLSENSLSPQLPAPHGRRDRKPMDRPQSSHLVKT